MRRKIYAVLFGLLPLSLILMLFEEWFVENGVLNTKDLQGVAGGEKGRFFDYATNAWVWDGVVLILMGAGVIGAIIGMIMLTESKARLPQEE